MLVAGSRHYTWRLATIGAITFLAILMGATYVGSGVGAAPALLGVTCAAMFYLALFIRILMDRDRR